MSALLLLSSLTATSLQRGPDLRRDKAVQGHRSSPRAYRGLELLQGWQRKPGPQLRSMSSRQAGLPPALDIPWAMNEEVAHFVRHYAGPGRQYFQKWLDRGWALIPRLRQGLEQEGAPLDLVYLAMIESGFRGQAKSRAGAQGLWQFIGATGRAFGLDRSAWVDDRGDPEEATRAAARYLLRLYDRFQDWHLAWAAYNAGPGRVYRAMRETGETEFWKIAQAGALPRETREYVPRILAAATIATQPERYGFRINRPKSPVVIRKVLVERPLTFETIENACGIKAGQLIELNPNLYRKVTPPAHMVGEPHPLSIPASAAEDCAELLVKLPPEANHYVHNYTIKSGDTLGGIASRWNVKISLLMQVNNLGPRSVLRIGRRLVIPTTTP